MRDPFSWKWDFAYILLWLINKLIFILRNVEVKEKGTKYEKNEKREHEAHYRKTNLEKWKLESFASFASERYT